MSGANRRHKICIDTVQALRFGPTCLHAHIVSLADPRDRAGPGTPGLGMSRLHFRGRIQPEARRFATLTNFGVAAVYGAVAAHNYRNPR